MILDQLDVYTKIKNSFENFNKKPVKTVGGVDSRLLQLDKWWSQYQENHSKILPLKDDSNKNHEYFNLASCSINEVENLYIDLRGDFLQMKNELTSSVFQRQTSNNSNNTVVISETRLPPVSLPTF